MDRDNITVIVRFFKNYAKTLGICFTQYIVPGIQELLRIVFESLEALIDGLIPKSHEYKATFTSSDEILSKNNTGVCLDGRRQLSKKAVHVLCVSPSGGGKTQNVVLPTVLLAKGSFVINDPSKEIFNTCASYLESQGVDVRVVNFADPTQSDGFNPLAYVRDGADAQKMASILVRSVLQGSNSGDQFWNISATSLITFAIKLLQTQNIKYYNFANVRLLVQLMAIDSPEVDRMVAQSGNQEIILEYKNFLKQDNKLRTSVIATTLASLSIFQNPTVAKVTSTNTIDLSNIRKKRMAIFLHTSTTDMVYFSNLISIFFESVMKVLMSELPGTDDTEQVYLILEELSSLFLPGLEIASSNLRKGNGTLVLILQSFQQLVQIYSRERAEAIRSNCYVKMYFSGMDHTTSEELARQLGKYTWYEEGNKKRNTRELLTSDELRMMKRNTALVICSNLNPMMISLRPLYDNPFLKLKTERPTLTIRGRLHEEPVELITE
ncbi:MAG: type IV secretory system conjugative DNA transfer family protein [Chitinophagales bacterium]|nr:type IV secretory system conjugative DNA transfer family protein [Chitinophagales bacterium]